MAQLPPREHVLKQAASRFWCCLLISLTAHNKERRAAAKRTSIGQMRALGDWKPTPAHHPTETACLGAFAAAAAFRASASALTFAACASASVS